MSGGATTVRIAVPSLGQAAAGLAPSGGPALRLPAAEWLVARGRRAAGPASSWREWLLAGDRLGADVLARFAAGPCAYAAWTGQASSATWACAAPVHLVAAIDHLQLAAPAPLPLAAGESEALLVSLNGHLAGSGFALHGFSGRGWLCECPPGLECAAVEPAAAVGGNLRELLPAGRDAVRVRGLVNELQMLLHDHPVNERRAARGELPVNSVWLWGFGAAGESRAATPGALFTDDDWLAGLWRLHGAQAAQPAQVGAALRDTGGELFVGLAPTACGAIDDERWHAADRAVMEPARAALCDGTVDRVSLCTGGAVFEITRTARWRFWRGSRPIQELLS